MANEEGASAGSLRSLWMATGVIGFAAGLFAGMSESPVATALIGGVFGLIGGGGLYGLLSRSKVGDTREASSGSREIDWTVIRVTSKTASLLCICAIAGVILGVGFRDGWALPQPTKKESSALLVIADKSRDLERRQQLKLLLLQAELKSLGVSNEENNHFVASFIADDDSTAAKGLAEDNLRSLKRSTADLAKALEGAVGGLTLPDLAKAKKMESGEIDEDSAPRRLMSVKEIRYADVARAYAFLRIAEELATKVETYVYHSSAPELSLVLDLISRYREASVDQPAAGRAGVLLPRRGRFEQIDRERKVTLRP